MNAADQLDDAHALPLLDRMLTTLQHDQDAGRDGSFFGARLAELARENPYYSSRLEGDRANALSLVATHLGGVRAPDPPAEPFEQSVAGAWSEPEHGGVLHRSPRRLASFSWRAYGLAAGLVAPPGRGDLAEWHQNLGGWVRFAGDQSADDRLSRELLDNRTTELDGGFATSGEVVEGRTLALDESWRGERAATSRIAFVALPDDRTVVGFHRCVVGDWSPIVAELQGLHLGVPNDLFSGSVRTVSTAAGTEELVAGEEGIERLGRWACIDDALGVVGVYGATELVMIRSARRGARRGSLYVDHVAFPYRTGPFQVRPRTDLVDIGWVALAGTGAQETAAVADAVTHTISDEGLRTITVPGADGTRYLVAVNLGASGTRRPTEGRDLTGGRQGGRLAPGEIAVAALGTRA